MAEKETKQSLMSEVLKWVNLSKGGKFVGLGTVMLVVSVALFYYIDLTPVKYRGVELVWLWVIGQMLLLPGVVIVIVGLLIVILGLIALFRVHSSKRVKD